LLKPIIASLDKEMLQEAIRRKRWPLGDFPLGL
jgi:hypothetical protein